MKLKHKVPRLRKPIEPDFDETGEPLFWIDGVAYPAKRVVWRIHYGEDPGVENDVVSTCGNQRCVNPAHLELRSMSRRH